MRRRTFMLGTAAVLASAAWPRTSRANIRTPYSFDLQPPTTGREAFIKWAVEHRGENPKILAARWDRYAFLRANNDFVNARNGRAFLLTPRDEFVLKRDIVRAYERDFHDIGFGVTISGPLVVSRMTSTIDVQPGEKVLEIGTGSGNQSAYLANLTDKVWTIEIIKPLAERTRGIYDDLIARGYSEYKAINSKHADGYYGWEEAAPFDKIIVTCGIDHIPPPLLAQLRANGIMVIPIGPPGAHPHPQGGEAAGRRRRHPGGALQRLQQGRSVRAVHQARRRSHQGHPRRTAVMRAAGGAMFGARRPACAGSLRRDCSFSATLRRNLRTLKPKSSTAAARPVQFQTRLRGVRASNTQTCEALPC